MRYKYLDYAKGLSILLMFFTHTMSGTNWMSTWVFSFHMPIFFVICGILLEEKYAGHVTVHQYAALVRRRMVQIGVPYLVFGSALALFYSLLNVIAGQPVTMLRRMWELITLQGIDSLWFLPCYVLAEFLAAAVRICDSRAMQIGRKLLFAAVAVLLCLLAGNMPTDWRLRVLLKSLIGWIFVEIGISLSKHRIHEKIPIGGVTALLVIGAVLSEYNGFSAIGSLQLQNPLLFFANAAMTSTGILALCKYAETARAEHLKWLELYGRNTIVMVCTNNLLIEIIRLFDYKLFGNVLLRSGLMGCVVFTAILLVIEYILIRMAQGPLGVLFGRISLKRK